MRTMQHDDHEPTRPAYGASGYVCPCCGGSHWERGGDASISYTCRIGDRYSQTKM
jgi:hypothetical protein